MLTLYSIVSVYLMLQEPGLSSCEVDHWETVLFNTNHI